MQDFSITVCLGSLLYSLDSEGCVRCLGGADSGNAMFWTGVVVFARTLYVCLVNQHAATLLVVGIGLIGKPDFDTLAACKGSDGFFSLKAPPAPPKQNRFPRLQLPAPPSEEETEKWPRHPEAKKLRKYLSKVLSIYSNMASPSWRHPLRASPLNTDMKNARQSLANAEALTFPILITKGREIVDLVVNVDNLRKALEALEIAETDDNFVALFLATAPVVEQIENMRLVPAAEILVLQVVHSCYNTL